MRGSNKKLRIAYTSTCGHPQALIWLIALVTEPSIFTLEQACSEIGIWDLEEGEIATKIFDKVFDTTLSALEREILCNLWVFNEPIPPDVLMHFDQSLSLSKISRSINNLINKAILNIYPNGAVSIDDLVHEYVTHYVQNKKQKHELAAQWYENRQNLPYEIWKSREDAHPTLRTVHHYILANHKCKLKQIAC